VTNARTTPPRLMAALIGVMLIFPAVASAHAQLEGTSPPQGATVKPEPAAVIFRFDEPVEGNFGAVRVYDADGARVDQGDAFHPDGDGPRLGVHLKPDLPDGSYTATYRVVSADGHIVSSGYVFSIGKPGRAPKETVAQLVNSSGSGPVTEIAFGAARALQYGAVAVGLGGLGFLILVWLPALAAVARGDESWIRASGALARRSRRILICTAIVGALSAAVAVVLEGAEGAGVSAWSALDGTIIREVLGTRFGLVWGLCAASWAVVGLSAALVLRGRRQPSLALRPAQLGATGLAPTNRRAAAIRLLPLLVPMAFVVMAPALSGHASTQSPVAILFPANVVHVIAMAIWLGGLAWLLVAVPVATRELSSPDRSRLLAGVLTRFSGIALIAVAAILATGLLQAYAYVRHLPSLIETGYGRAVLIKFCLLVLLIGIGAYNRRVSVPRLERIAAGGESPGRAGILLRRALRSEVALLVVVLGVTGALASYAPSVSAQSGPFSTDTTLGPTEFEMTVDPARVGANQIHIYMFDASTGGQFTGAKEVDVSATLPDKRIGPLALQPEKSGPGHYTVPSATLNVAGDWKIQTTVRVSAFNEYTKTIEVPIR
jgi:copper transport protein